MIVFNFLHEFVNSLNNFDKNGTYCNLVLGIGSLGLKALQLY